MRIKPNLKINTKVAIFTLFVLAFSLRIFKITVLDYVHPDEVLVFRLLAQNNLGTVCRYGYDCLLPLGSFLFSIPRLFFSPFGVLLVDRLIVLGINMVALAIAYRSTKQLLKNATSRLLFLFLVGTNLLLIFTSRYATPLTLSFPFLVIGWSLYYLKLPTGSVAIRPYFSVLLAAISALTSSYMLIPSLISILFFTKNVSKLSRSIVIVSTLAVSAILLSYPPVRISVFGYFNDIGLLNAVNASRGIESQFHGEFIGRLVYNKISLAYLWLGNFLSLFNPTRYFSLIEPSTNTTYTYYPLFPLVLLPITLLGIVRLHLLQLKKLMPLLILIIVPMSLVDRSVSVDLAVGLAFVLLYFLAKTIPVFVKKSWLMILILSFLALNLYLQLSRSYRPGNNGYLEVARFYQNNIPSND